MKLLVFTTLCFVTTSGFEVIYSSTGFCRFGVMSRANIISMRECLPETGIYSYIGASGTVCHFLNQVGRSTCRARAKVKQKSVYVCHTRNGRDLVDDDCTNSAEEVVLKEETTIEPSSTSKSTEESLNDEEIEDTDISSPCCKEILQAVRKLETDVGLLKHQGETLLTKQGEKLLKDPGETRTNSVESEVSENLELEVIASGQPEQPTGMLDDKAEGTT